MTQTENTFREMVRDESVVDCYAGMGGFGAGFKRYFNVVDAVDIWPTACETYSLNHRETKVHQARVDHFLADCTRKDYEGALFTGIIGGPPCQDYSVLNQSPNHQSVRAQQAEMFAQKIVELRPHFAMMENVARIPAKIKFHVQKTLENAGYHVVSKVVLAYNYNSVQKRRRWILTASLERAIFPHPAKGRRTAQEILIPGSKSEMQMSERVRLGLQNLPTGRWICLPKKKWKEYFIIDPNRPLPTVVNVLKNRIVRPDRSSYLSFAEVKQAQGFAPTYQMAGSMAAKAQQLANAIPVELAHTFAREFYSELHPLASKMDAYLPSVGAR